MVFPFLCSHTQFIIYSTVAHPWHHLHFCSTSLSALDFRVCLVVGFFFCSHDFLACGCELFCIWSQQNMLRLHSSVFVFCCCCSSSSRNIIVFFPMLDTVYFRGILLYNVSLFRSISCQWVVLIVALHRRYVCLGSVLQYSGVARNAQHVHAPGWPTIPKKGCFAARGLPDSLSVWQIFEGLSQTVSFFHTHTEYMYVQFESRLYCNETTLYEQ